MSTKEGIKLPGFSKERQCWKCQGRGMNPRKKGGRCSICGGSGQLAARIVKCNAGRVTRGPSEGDMNWIGPEPVGAEVPENGVDLCCLSGRWRIFQRQNGHRYSTEDVVTAWVASRLLMNEDRVRHIDLGSGIGSVLLFVAWQCDKMNDYKGLSVEAQEDSWQLAQRSIAYNGAPCTALLGDLRTFVDDKALASFLKSTHDDTFFLLTGTPPYFGTTGFGALPSCEQSAGARFEFRGGIEDYCLAAAAILRRFCSDTKKKSRFVCCEGGLDYNRDRVEKAAHIAGLSILNRQFVVGRLGKPPLFGVWTMALSSSFFQEELIEAPVLVVRDCNANRTPEYNRVLHDMAMLRSDDEPGLREAKEAS